MSTEGSHKRRRTNELRERRLQVRDQDTAHDCIVTLYTATNDHGGEVFGAKHQKTNHTKTSPHWSRKPRLTDIKAQQGSLPAVLLTG